MLATTLEYARTVSTGFAETHVDDLAAWMYPRVLRENFDAPGFALLSFATDIDSRQLRQVMVELKQKLSDIHQPRAGRELCYRSMGRFNQQTTTRFHLDGAPEQSFLMLGYEPSVVASELAMADYSHAAFDLAITPAEYLERHNPMFPAQEARLAGYITALSAFDHRRPQILCINNSRQAFNGSDPNQLGIFHQATIREPQPDELRVVNSTMIGICPDLSGETVSKELQFSFVKTSEISGPQYN